MLSIYEYSIESRGRDHRDYCRVPYGADPGSTEDGATEPEAAGP